MSTASVADAMKAEISQLEKVLQRDPHYVRLRKLQAWLVEEEEAQAAAAKRAERRPTRSKSKKTEDLLELAGALILEHKGTPVPTAVILKVAQHHNLAGKGRKASNRLSATLSHHGFTSHGRAGWTHPAQERVAALVKNTEAAGPGLEVKEPAASADRHHASGGTTAQGREAGPGGGT